MIGNVSLIFLAVASMGVMYSFISAPKELKAPMDFNLEAPANIRAINNNSYYGSAAYQAQNASTKQGQLWAEMIANTTSHAWYSATQQAQLITENKDYVFNYKGDALPGTFKKLIHTVGVVAKAQFVPVAGTNYTGIFNGSNNIIVRLSVATEYDTSKPADGNFVPSASIKFLRDNQTAGNFFSLYSLDGVPTWNFFGYNFSNHVPVPKNSASNFILGKSFSAVT